MRVTSEFESHFPHMMQLTQPRELEVERQCRYQVALGDLENAIKEPELEPWFERVTERGPKTFEAMCLLLPTADLEAILVRCEVPAGANGGIGHSNGVVLQLDQRTGQVLRAHASYRMAAAAMWAKFPRASFGNIQAAVAGARKQAYGYCWRTLAAGDAQLSYLRWFGEGHEVDKTAEPGDACVSCLACRQVARGCSCNEPVHVQSGCGLPLTFVPRRVSFMGDKCEDEVSDDDDGSPPTAYETALFERVLEPEFPALVMAASTGHRRRRAHGGRLRSRRMP